MADLVFNEEDYLDANPDVANAVRNRAFRNGFEHYEQFGKNERRPLSVAERLDSREDKVFYLLDKKGLGLEIGPSHNPIAPKKNGFNVHILDHACAADLKSKYQGHGVNLDNIEEVDFVWKGETFQDLIGRKNCYDWIIDSHVIEHVPDLISYLQQCEVMLKPDGILSLVIPDKRYCFDYFSSTSSTGAFYDAYAESRKRPSHGQIFDHFSNASKRNGNIAWSSDGVVGATELLHTFSEAQDQLNNSISQAEYIDVHCWRFTPESFRLLITDLQRLGLIHMEIKSDFETTGCEFYMALGKTGNLPLESSRLHALQTIKLENYSNQVEV